MTAGKELNEAAEVIENVPEQDRAHVVEFEAPMEHIQELNEAEHINLSWRSWLVVFVTCFAIMAQVFVVVAAGSVIAFIIRDVGDGAIAGWIIRKCHNCTRSMSSLLTSMDRGALADAKCLVTHCRPTQ